MEGVASAGLGLELGAINGGSTLETEASLDRLQSIEVRARHLISDFRLGKTGTTTYVVKFPEKSIAPPTYVRAGKEMVVRAVLLAISLAPAMDVRAGKVRFWTPVLPTKVKLPMPCLASPMLVRLGALRPERVFSSKVRVPLITDRDGMLMTDALRNVALLAQIRLGRSTERASPLEAMSSRVPTLLTWVEMVVRRRLLLTSNVSTVSKLIPLRVVKPVFSMVTLEALEMESVRVN